MQILTKKRIANITSGVLNPLLVGAGIILLLSFESTSSTPDALKWGFISIALVILPVFLVVIYLVRNGTLDSIFIRIRGQRTGIYWLAVACTGAACIILHCFGAPLMLVATFVAGLSAVIVFMCINMWWKISLHTAIIAASITASVILYGWIAAATVVLVPLMSWSRIELKHHSLAQVAAGTLLAALIVAVVFYLFDLV